MSICDHGLVPANCMLCKKLLPPVAPQNHTLAADSGNQLAGTTIMVKDAPVHITDSEPELTDPAAKNVLQLAQEYAKAKEDLGVAENMVKNFNRMKEESHTRVVELKSICADKKKALQKALQGVGQ